MRIGKAIEAGAYVMPPIFRMAGKSAAGLVPLTIAGRDQQYKTCERRFISRSSLVRAGIVWKY